MPRMTPDDIARANDLACRKPAYIAWALAEYRFRTGRCPLEALGADEATAGHLGLYLMPRREHWEDDLRSTAADCGVDAGRLGEVLEVVRAIL